MKKIIISALFLSLGLFAGYLLGAKAKIALPKTIAPVDQDFFSLKEKLLKARVITDSASSLNGVVLAVSGKEVSFSAPLVNPLQDESLKNRIAVVGEKTKIYVYTLRSEDEIKKAVADSVAELAKLENDLSVASLAVKNCLSDSGKNCLDERKNAQDIKDKINQIKSLFDKYAKAEGSISDIKPGWKIVAVAEKIEDKNAERNSKPVAVNIAYEAKFNVFMIEVREVEEKIKNIN